MRAGFTLVEILIVLAILGLSAGVAVPPLLDWVADGRQTGAVGDVLHLAQSVRGTALREARATELTIDSRTGRYWITAHDPERPLRGSGTLSLGSAELVGTGARLSVRWDARGGANGDSILIRTDAGVRVVGADRWTGRPYVHAR